MLDEADKLFELECAKDTTKKRKRQGQGSRGDEDGDEEGEDDDDNSAGSSSFLRQIDEILSKCPGTSSTGASLQRGLFSATLGPFVRELAASFLRDPIVVTIGTENTGASTIDQKLIFVGREEGKVLAVRQLIQQGIRPPVLLFLQSKDRAKGNSILSSMIPNQTTVFLCLQNRGQAFTKEEYDCASITPHHYSLARPYSSYHAT